MKKINIRLIAVVLPIVIVLIIVCLGTSANIVVNLYEDNIVSDSELCALKMESWASGIIKELEVYKRSVEETFDDNDNEAIEKYIKTAYGIHDAYPVGLYIGDDSGVYIDGSNWVPPDDYVITDRPWYVEGKNSAQFVFGEPYTDAMLNETCVSVSARLERDDNITRVMAADVYLDYAESLVDSLKSDDQNSDSKMEFAMLITGDNLVIVNSGNDNECVDLSQSDIAIADSVEKIIKNKKFGLSEVKDKDGNSQYVCVNKIDSTGWFLVTSVSKMTVIMPMIKVFGIMVAFSALCVILLTNILRRFSRDIVKLDEKASTDKLTHILNRSGFEKAVLENLKENDGVGLFVLTDLDNFKSINDNLGHPEGDKVLEDFGKLVDDYFNRKNDIVGRLGGDEFAVYIGRDMSKEDEQNMLDTFLEHFNDSIGKRYKEYKLSVSMGAVDITGEDNFDALYEKADKALYFVKQNGKNGVHINI